MFSVSSTVFFQCSKCHVECRVDSVLLEASGSPLLVRHCPDGEGVTVTGKVTRFQERRGGLWVDVQINAA
jgi:hypothetical protein